MVGRKPKPTQLKIVTGNPGHRALNGSEPKSSVVHPKPPTFLSPEAKKGWKALSTWLADAGILTQLDTPALEVLCTFYARWKVAEQSVNKLMREAEGKIGGGLLIHSKKGVYIQNPLVGIANRASEGLMKCLIEFGMTPSARTRIHADNAQEKNSKAASYFQKAK